MITAPLVRVSQLYNHSKALSFIQTTAKKNMETTVWAAEPAGDQPAENCSKNLHQDEHREDSTNHTE